MYNGFELDHAPVVSRRKSIVTGLLFAPNDAAINCSPVLALAADEREYICGLK